MHPSIQVGSQIVVSPQKKEKKPVVPRDFRIHGVSRALLDANLVDPTQIRIRAKTEISLSEAVPAEVKTLLTKVSLQWRVMEEGSSGGVVDEKLDRLAGGPDPGHEVGFRRNGVKPDLI